MKLLLFFGAFCSAEELALDVSSNSKNKVRPRWPWSHDKSQLAFGSTNAIIFLGMSMELLESFLGLRASSFPMISIHTFEVE